MDPRIALSLALFEAEPRSEAEPRRSEAVSGRSGEQATHRRRRDGKKEETHASSLFPCSCSIPTNGIPNSIS